MSKPRGHIEYEPTREQIAAACAEIQGEWTPWVRYRRSGGRDRSEEEGIRAVRFGEIDECQPLADGAI